MDWQAIIAPAAIVSAAVAIGAFVYAINNAKEQAGSIVPIAVPLSILPVHFAQIAVSN